MNDDRRTDSVRHLQLLYSTVVGLGLAVAMTRAVDVGQAHVTLDWRSLPVLVAYISTLIPFYHGALRHLDDGYIHDSAAEHGRSGLLLADFAVLFIEGSLLFALAAFMPAPTSFAFALLLLLAVDTVWGVIFHRVTTRPMSASSTELKWARLNAITILTLSMLLLLSVVLDIDGDRQRLILGVIVLLVAVARTVFDYRYSWRFYFPA